MGLFGVSSAEETCSGFLGVDIAKGYCSRPRVVAQAFSGEALSLWLCRILPGLNCLHIKHLHNQM